MYKSKSLRKHSRKQNKRTIKKIKVQKRKIVKKTPKHIKKSNKTIKRRKQIRKMKGGNTEIVQANNPITFIPKGLMNMIPHYPLSGDIHGQNNMIESSTNVPVQTAGGLTDFIPTDITNLGRGMIYGARGLYNGFIGDVLPNSANPNVLNQPELKEMPELNIEPADVIDIYKQSDGAVAAETK